MKCIDGSMVIAADSDREPYASPSVEVLALGKDDVVRTSMYSHYHDLENPDQPVV